MWPRVDMKLLPGETEKIRIHYFVRDPNGPGKSSKGDGRLGAYAESLGGMRGYLACQPKSDKVGTTVIQGVPYMKHHTDDPRAATCPECLASNEYAAMMKRLGEIVDTAKEG